MHRIDSYGATPDNKFTEGTPGPGVPVPPTEVSADIMNDMQENLCLVIEAAGIALVKGDYTQLLEAIRKISGSQVTRKVDVSGPVLVADSVLLVDCTAGPVTLTLLSAAAANARSITIIKADDSDNLLTLRAQAGQTLPTGEGRQDTVDLTLQEESIQILPDGVSHWYRVV
jgi:hypothetical protein